MKFLLSLITALLFAAPVFAQPGVDEIVNKIVEKRVEGTNLDDIKSYKLDVTLMQPMQGNEMEMKMYFKRPDMYRMEQIIGITGQKTVQTYNGEEAWVVSNMGKEPIEEELDEEQIEQLKNQVDVLESNLENYKEKGIEIKYLTEDMVDEKDVYKLKVIEDGEERIIYVDTKEYVVVKTEGTREIQGQEVPLEFYQKNYSRENGILIPHAIEVKFHGQVVMIYIFEKFEFNVELDDSLFDKPVLE